MLLITKLVFLYRIRSETNGGAWCPADRVSKDNLEYLQIDLGALKVVTLIETQGRFGQGQVSEAHLFLLLLTTKLFIRRCGCSHYVMAMCFCLCVCLLVCLSPVAKDRYMTILSTYAPTLTSDESSKIAFMTLSVQLFGVFLKLLYSVVLMPGSNPITTYGISMLWTTSTVMVCVC